MQKIWIFFVSTRLRRDTRCFCGLRGNSLRVGPDPIELGSRFSGIGGIIATTVQHDILQFRGPGRVSPLAIPMMIADSASGDLSIRYGAKGPNFGIVSACASGCHSVGEAYWMIERDDADIMLAGGTEESVMPLCIAGFSSMKAMSMRNDDPLHQVAFRFGSGRILRLRALEFSSWKSWTRKKNEAAICRSGRIRRNGDAFHIRVPTPAETETRAFRLAMRLRKLAGRNRLH